MPGFRATISFDLDALSRELESLPTATLQKILDLSVDDVHRPPLDIFISKYVPTLDADGAGEIICGLRLLRNAEVYSAA